MGASALDERYCTVKESMIESFKEVKLMREGKLPKRSWQDFMRTISENHILQKRR